MSLERITGCGFQVPIDKPIELENLFSIIRFKGGFRDNPDPQQFRAAFRHVIVDKLFVNSTSANCQLDADKILLDISNVTIKQKISMIADNSTYAVDPLTVAMPAPSFPKRNVVAYMTGYLMKCYPVDNCSKCSELFKIHSLPESSPVSDYELQQCKMYKSTSNLVIASPMFSNFVQARKLFSVACLV